SPPRAEAFARPAPPRAVAGAAPRPPPPPRAGVGQFVADRPDADRAGRVAVPAVEDRAAVDRDQVPGLELGAVPGDAVHDLVVDGGADRRRITVIALEGRDGAGLADFPLGDRVEFRGGDARLDRGRQHVQRARHHQAGLPHRGELAWRLDLNRRFPPGPHGASGFLFPRYRRAPVLVCARSPVACGGSGSVRGSAQCGVRLSAGFGSADEAAQRAQGPVGDLLDRAGGVHAEQDALVRVERDQRLGLLLINVQTVPDRLFPVVVALEQFTAAVVAVLAAG